MKKNVYVLYGGKSAEHQVSIDSALNVLNELNKDFYEVFAVYITQEGKWNEPFQVDKSGIRKQQLVRDTASELRVSISQFLQLIDDQSIIFPVLHGTFGEDGKLQGMLEILDIPYVGNGVIASAVGMDKVVSKKVFANHDIPQTMYVYFTRMLYKEDEDHYIKLVQGKIGFPCYVKPANMGSSVGISHCHDEADLKKAISSAFLFDDKILIEKEVIGKEVILGVTGNDHLLQCSLAGEWQREQHFFDYEDKYLDDQLTPQIPALISNEIYEKLCDYAKLAFTALDGTGLIRVDFFVTEAGDIYLNEVNTLPGFTKHSMFPVLFERTEGLTYSELLDRLIELGFDAYQKQNRLQFERVKA